jgi:hypothetical protein
MSKQKTFIDPDNYARCSAPFETAEEANAALDAFWDEFYELRNKHRIADVLVTFRLQVRQKDGGAAEMFGSLMAGNQMYAEPLAAWSLGKASADRQEMIGRFVAQSVNVAGGLNNLQRKSK